MGFIERWILSLLPTGLMLMQTLIKTNINNPEFWRKYGDVLRRIVQIGKIVEPYTDESGKF